MTINTSTYLFSIVTRLCVKSVLMIVLWLSSFPIYAQFTDVQVFAGKDTAICRYSSLDLKKVGAFIRGEVTDGTWFTLGDGRFFPSNSGMGQFSLTDTYKPGPNDIHKGYVDILLTSFDPDGNGPKTQITEKMRLTLLFDPPMVCNTNLNVSLAAHCSQEILASMLLSNMQGNHTDYSVKLFDNGIELPSNVITREYLNKTLEFRVQHNCGESNCWGYITAQDKEAPRLHCKDTTVECTSSTLPDSIGFPIQYESATLIGDNKYKMTKGDNCGDATLVYSDEVIKLSCSSSGFNERINRRWEAVDDLGNKRSCIQVIYVKAKSLSTITLPPHYDDIDQPAFICGSNFSKLANGHPSLQASGSPFAQGCSNLEFTFTDTKIMECGDAFKILRRWIMIDWCQSLTKEHIQIIKILDKTPPKVECPSPITLTTTAYDCHTGVKEIPAPKITDNCGSFTYQINIFDSLKRNQNVFLTQNDNKYFTNNLPFGKYNIQYIAIDDCQNKDTCYTSLTVIDDQPPFVFCTDRIVVNLNESSYLRLFPESVDQGSSDNCGIAKYEVAKMTDDCYNKASVFGPYVEFCCSDLGKTVMVSLRVTDKSGNMNTCMIEVSVRDKTPPIITCPPSVTINCDYSLDLNNLNEFGVVTNHPSKVKDIIIGDKVIGKDGMAIDTCGVTIYEKVIDQRACHSGQIIRRFYAVDASGNVDSCTQIITVINQTPFTDKNITWPRDTTLVSCSADSINIHVTGIPKFINEQCAVLISNYEDQLFETNEAGNCFKIIRQWKVLDWCRFENGETSGVWYHDQIIKLTNNIAPTITNICNDTIICNNNDTCGTTTYSQIFQAFDDCSPSNKMRWKWTIDLENNGSIDVTGLTSEVKSDLPNGKHKVTIEVKDACGNSTSCTYIITVKDCKPPIPYCILSLSTAIMENGMITIWAKDFDRGSLDNCTSTSKLKFSFSEHVQDTSRTYTCDSLDNLKSKDFLLQMWVTDEDGNQDFCNTLLTVQDNGNICKSGNVLTTLTGHIKDIHGVGVTDYFITVRDMDYNFITKKVFNSPTFTIDSVYTNNQYRLYIEKENILGPEVNVFDLLKIQRHILGIKKFISPLEFLAADVDNNQRVNVSDIIEIRSYILGINDMYDTSLKIWQFVDENYKFDNPSRPDRNEIFIVTDTLVNGLNHLNVTAYKLGNVESFGQISSRSNKEILLDIKQNNEVTEIRTAKDVRFDAIHLDMAISLNNPEIIFNPSIDAEYHTHNLPNGYTRILIYNANGIHLYANDWIIKLQGSIVSHTNENGVIEGEPAQLLIRQVHPHPNLEVYQNYNQLIVKIENQSVLNSRIELYNTQGQKLINTIIDQSESVDISDIKTGIYFYKIYREDAIYSGKMMIQN